MASNTKTSKRKKQIEELKEELIKNDDIIKKNIEDRDNQIQIGLKDRHYPPYPYYNNVMNDLKREIKLLEIQLRSGFKTINTLFEYQTDPEWIELQMNTATESLESNKKNLKKITGDVEEVKNNLIAQSERIKNRRVHILEDLKKMKVDIREFTDKSKNYIG